MFKKELYTFVLLCFILGTISFGTPILPEKIQAVLKMEQVPGVYQDDSLVGLFNRNIVILFEKKTGNLKGIWSTKGRWFSAGNIDDNGQKICDLWQIEVMPANSEIPLLMESGYFKPTEIKTVREENSVSLLISYLHIISDKYAVDTVLSIKLGSDDKNASWRISVTPSEKRDDFSIWNVKYPIIGVPFFDGGNNSLAVPYRQGMLRTYGTGRPEYGISSPYPGSAAKFQFMAGYGDSSGKGFYFSTEDGEGYSKVFNYSNESKLGRLILSVDHLPANRGISGTGFVLPYETVTGPFVGDWWTAARIYRLWWVKQIWASKGLLRYRKDIPDWLKNSPVALRFSTLSPERTIEKNLKAGLEISRYINGIPAFGIWYGPFGEQLYQPRRGVDFHGHKQAVSLPVKDALGVMGRHNVHFMAFVQSVIYDLLYKENYSEEETKAVQTNVVRNRKGDMLYYGDYKPESGQAAMCRSTEWWQNRVVDISVNAVKNGFRGIYLDSFGKEEHECFAPNHGHSMGGGNKIVAGQRNLAEKVLAAIRKIDTEAIISGEAPIEAFRDIVSVNLLATDMFDKCIPLARTIYGDYSLEYGRVIRGENIIPVLGYYFVNGNIMGRFFCSSGEIFENDSAMEKNRQYLQKLANYTSVGIEYLRFGEYLRPLELKVPKIIIRDTISNKKLHIPAVMNSVTRSHKDGSVGIVLTNVSDKPVKMAVPFDKDWRGPELKGSDARLYQINESGELHEVCRGEDVAKKSLEILPQDVIFLVLK